MRWACPRWISPAVVGALLLAVGVFFLHTRHNHAPFWYGYDEEGKGRQVVEGYRNLTHPLLNVNISALACRVRGPWPPSLQHAVEVGRVGAAAGVALAAFALCVLAGRKAGVVAGVLAGLSLAWHPAFMYAGRFFKEDGLLVGTWALLMLALEGYRLRPGARTSALAGGAAGLCAAAKYVGLLPAVLGLAVLGWGTAGTSRRARAGFALLYLAVALVVWAGINYQLLMDAGRALSRMRAEVDLLLHETTSAGPAWLMLARTSGWSGLLGLSIYFIQRTRWPDRWPRIEIFGLLSAGLYGLGYLLIERSAERYFLPLWLVEWWLTAVGFGLWWQRLRGASSHYGFRVLWLMLLVLTYTPTLQSGLRRYQSYAQTNPRLLMAHYIDQHLPADALVVYDATVNLPDAGREQRQVQGFAPRQRLRELTPDLVVGTNILESLRSFGVTHVVMSPRRMAFFEQPNYLRIFHRDPHAAMRPAFHEALLQQANLLHTVPAGPDPFVAPGLILYRL